MSSNFILIYCSDNQSIVEKFSSDLSSVGAQFKLVAADQQSNITTVLDATTPIILFVTDNFLKNRNCMFKAYTNLGHLIKNGQILPIITEGFIKKEDGTKIPVTTRIERVANVIQYMNYWQDKYLAMRKEHNIGNLSEDEVNTVKTISTEVGDFARLLKDSNFQYFENLTARNYQSFCQIAGLPMPSHASFEQEPEIELVNTNIETNTLQEAPSSVPVLIDDNSREESSPIESAENQFITLEKAIAITTETEDEAIEQIIADIPGVAMLKDPIPTTNVSSNFVNEIDEDDFFKTENDNIKGSNVNEIISDVMFEEENESNQAGHDNSENVRIDDIFDDDDEIISEDTTSETVEDDEVNNIFDNITKLTNAPADENIEVINEGLNLSENESYSISDIFKDTEGSEIELLRFNSKANDIEEIEGSEEDEQNTTDENQELEENLKDKLLSALNLAKSGDLKKATQILEKVLEVSPQNADAFFILAEIAELNKDFIMAKAYYEKTVFTAPFYPLVYEKLAKLSAAHFEDDDKQTKKYFKKALKVDENNPALLYAYAEFLNDKMDNAEKAIKYFEKVLEVDPNHQFANYDLAVIYYKLGNKNTAADYYRNACENNDEISTEENDEVFLNYSVLDLDRAGEAINLHNVDNEGEMNPIESVNDDFVEKTETFEGENIEDGINEKINESNEEDEKVDEINEEGTDENEVVEIIDIEKNNLILEDSHNPEVVGEANGINPIAISDEAMTEKTTTINETINKLLPKEGAKIILITGATAGIGKATAEVFAKNGYNVILSGRRQERLLELQNEFHEKYKSGCIAIDFDIQNYQSIQDALDSLDDAWKNVDILINNAGLALGLEPIHEGTLSHWDTMIDTNIKGLLYMTRLISPQMTVRRSGHIINLCSTAGKEAYANGNVYCATKFAVEALTRTMRIDLHKFGIRVGQVSPGAVETEFSKVRFEGDSERAAKVYDGFTPLIAEDVADIIFYMASAPAHVNIQDVLVMATQQASATIIDRSGKN